MYIQKRIQRLGLRMLLIAAIASFGACSSDDTSSLPQDTPEDFNPYVISLAVQGSEGDFTYYTVPFSDVMEGTLSARGQGIEQPGYYDFTQIDHTIYAIGGLDDVDMVGLRKDEEHSSLVVAGKVSFDNSLSDLKKADEHTLVSVTMNAASGVIVFHKFDLNAVTATDKITVPVSALVDLDTDEGLSYSGMEISGDHLFLSYYISNPETFETTHTDQAAVAVFSYPSLEFEKVITDSRVGPIGGFNVASGLVKDEQGNVFAVSHSNPANGFSQSTKPSGILKITAGETEFDPDYFFDITQATDGGNTAHLVYLGDGKAFAEVNTSPRSTQEVWSDSPLRSAVVDLNKQEVNFIKGIAQHKGNGRRLPLWQDAEQVYISIPEANEIYIYRIDIHSYEATKGAIVEANFIAGIFKL